IPETAVITTGENFPDSLVISGPAASKDMPILLVKPFTSEPPHETKLALVGVKRVIIVGGPGAVHPFLEDWLRRSGIDVLTRLWGLSEYDTAIDVVSTGDSIFKFNRSTTLVTRGDYFTDALAGGAFASTLGPAPMVLVKPDSIPLSTQYWLQGYKDDIDTIYVLGGWGAISQSVKDQVQGFVL
ncbi:MAG TPA: cell wall-binding repeat-containing protein, partial [Candidatus Subteraquimicrobiales bacterium]